MPKYDLFMADPDVDATDRMTWDYGLTIEALIQRVTDELWTEDVGDELVIRIRENVS